MVRRVKKKIKEKVFPMKFPLNPFAGTPESLEKVIDRLPNKFKEQSAQEFDKIYTKIPDEFKVTIGSTLYESYLQLRRGLLDIEERDFQHADGVIKYLQLDHGHTENIIFLHGFADDKDNTYDFAQEVSKRYNFYALDLPGFGGSFTQPLLPYNIENYREWIVSWIESLGLDSYHVVGNSLGGLLAMDVVSHLKSVDTLSLISPAGIIDKTIPSLYHELMAGENIFQVENMSDFDSFLNRIFTNKPLLPLFIKEFTYQRFKANYKWYGELVMRLFEHADSLDDPKIDKLIFNEKLKDFAVPVLVIWGKEDKFFPSKYANAIDESANIDIVKIEGVGHAPQMEVPAKTAEIVVDFLAS